MSRAAATKGAKEKIKMPSATTPVITHEIVPGKCTDADWISMLERDSSEEFVLEIVDEIMDYTVDIIYKNYIERQLLPFTIMQAKDAILQIIEWRFLARDEGETSVYDVGWIQDEEPEAAVTDCWAQGSVPKTEVSIPAPIPEELEVEELPAEEQKEEILQSSPRIFDELEDKVSDIETSEKTHTRETESLKRITLKIEKKRKFKPHRGKLRLPSFSQMTESLEKTELQIIASEIMAHQETEPQEMSSQLLSMPASCHSILKVQSGRPPGNKDVQYDEMGNVIAVVRLDSAKLPNYRVTVKYQVMDPSTEAAHQRLEAMRRGRFVAPTQKETVKNKQRPSFSSNYTTSLPKATAKPRKPILAPQPPSLIECMDIVAGVQVTEAGRTKKGPSRYIRKTDLLEQHQKDLKPVSVRIKPPAINVSDLLDRDSPILRPLATTPPLPPILSQTQVST